ncbi:MAG: hypothetical protein ACRD0A_13980 [Acidimicrobiales bacterium]
MKQMQARTTSAATPIERILSAHRFRRSARSTWETRTSRSGLERGDLRLEVGRAGVCVGVLGHWGLVVHRHIVPGARRGG